MCQKDLTFSFAAFLVSESIQLTRLRLSSNAHLTFVTMSSTWGMQRPTAPYHAYIVWHIWHNWCVHSQWPCRPQQRCLWQTWLRRRSLRRCLCHWHTASSAGCSSAKHKRNRDLLKKRAASDSLTVGNYTSSNAAVCLNCPFLQSSGLMRLTSPNYNNDPNRLMFNFKCIQSQNRSENICRISKSKWSETPSSTHNTYQYICRTSI